MIEWIWWEPGIYPGQTKTRGNTDRPFLTLKKGSPVQLFAGFVISRFLCPKIFGEPKQPSPETICSTSPTSVQEGMAGPVHCTLLQEGKN